MASEQAGMSTPAVPPRAGGDRRAADASVEDGSIVASTAGTARFRARFGQRSASDYFRELAPGLAVSSIGIGTYLGECTAADDARYIDAVRHAVAGGVNLIDTAINYRCQRSERAIGRALRLVADDGVGRDEVVVCSKAGYVPLDGEPPATREAYHEYLAGEYYARGIMTPEDVVAGGHCIAPPYLVDQVRRSRENLGLATIDLYYVHNPEQQLEVLPREKFLRRMRDAFVALEACAAQGEIARYGVATWQGLRAAPGTRTHIDLEDLVALAREAGGARHRFAAVQLPINLAMGEAIRAPTQRLKGRAVPLLEAAAELGIAVVASATLLQAKLTDGLPAQLGEAFPRLRSDAQRAIAFVRTLPGVTSALVGMKSVAHVEENLEVGRA